MPVMLIRIHGIIIMIYIIFWGTIYVIIKQKNWFWHLCRVQEPWHTANVPIFAVCKNHGTRQRFELCRVPHLQECRVVRLRHMPALQASRCLRTPLYDLAPAQRRRRGSDALLLPIVPFWPSSLLLTRCASHRRQVSFAISVVLVVRLLLRSFLLRVRWLVHSPSLCVF